MRILRINSYLYKRKDTLKISPKELVDTIKPDGTIYTDHKNNKFRLTFPTQPMWVTFTLTTESTTPEIFYA